VEGVNAVMVVVVGIMAWEYPLRLAGQRAASMQLSRIERRMQDILRDLGQFGPVRCLDCVKKCIIAVLPFCLLL
jgi:hypothetical protein